MQTFLPYPDFISSAAALDDHPPPFGSRLNKQITEAYQILQAIYENKGYIYHPAVHMWRGYEQALLMYAVAMTAEWNKRGHDKEHLAMQKATQLFHEYNPRGTTSNTVMPPWFGNPDFHIAHQSNLVRKDPDWYGPQFPGVPNNLPYIWPVSKDDIIWGSHESRVMRAQMGDYIEGDGAVHG